ncbi:MAG: hypothetical protein R6V53_07195, partial [Candidatus Woesearchaeota archaeon]
ISSVWAIKVFPEDKELDSYEGEQTHVITYLNDGPKAENIVLEISDDTDYLEDHVNIEPYQFVLEPNQKKNVKIMTSFPRNLSPEKHWLRIEPSVGDDFTLSFEVPGVARPDLRIAEMDISNTNPIAIYVELENAGNVIARTKPLIEVYNDTRKIDTIIYESEIMVQPFESKTVSLMYDTSGLEKEKYHLNATFSYNDGLLTNTLRKDFTIKQDGIAKASESFDFWYLGAGAFLVILFFILKPEYLRTPFLSKEDKAYRRRLIALEKRQKHMKHEIDHLVKKTNDFINDSNRWLKKKGVDFEFR